MTFRTRLVNYKPLGDDIVTKATEAAFKKHMRSLQKRARAGDQDAIRSLACIILMAPERS